MEHQQNLFWSANNEFTTDEPLYTTDNYCFDEPIFAESISDSSDSGNYSPGLSLAECNPSVFDMENTGNWQNSMGNCIEERYNNAQFSNEFSPQHLNQYQNEINHLNCTTLVHQQNDEVSIPISTANSIQQYADPSMVHSNGGKMLLLVNQQVLNSPTPIMLQPVTKVLLPTSQISHTPIKMEPKMMPSTSFILPPAAFTKTTGAVIAQNRKDEDIDFFKKKEERKMRNRAAAQLSRQRKKHEEDSLKKELERSKKLCTELEVENRQLKIRLQQLEEDKKNILKMHGIGVDAPIKRKIDDNMRHKNAAAKTAGVCMLLFFSWIIFPDFLNESPKQLLLENKLMENSNNQIKMQQKKAHGRLLQATNLTLERIENISMNSKNFNETTLNHNETFGNCGGYSKQHYNETLNLKLSEDLLTWIARHEILELPQLRRGKLQPLIQTNNAEQIKALPKLRINSNEFEAEQNNEKRIKQRKMGNERKERIRIGMRRNSQSPIDNKSMRDLRRVLSQIPTNSGGSGKLFSRQQMSKLIKSIKGNAEMEQKDNILYLIPMHDYFLLPPSANLDNSTNKIQLPKLSIIMPALSPPHNSSMPFNQLSMIRIDCDVVGTKFFYLPDKLVKSLLKVQTISTF